MKAEENISAVKNKELERIVDEKIRIENSPFILEIYKNVRKIKEEKLRDNIVMYGKEDFKKLYWKDSAISRVVVRYKDIMMCIEFYNKYNDNLLSNNITGLSKVIRKVARNVDLDRIVYVRIFKKGNVSLETGYTLEKGYCDKTREFNEDILDILTISLDEILVGKNNQFADIIKYLI